VRRRVFLGLAAGAVLARSAYSGDFPIQDVSQESSRVPTTGWESADGSSGLGGPGAPGVVAAAVFETASREFRRGIDAALAAALRMPGASGRDVWAALFRPDDRVAIKLNCLAGPGLSPRRDLVEGLVAGIRSAGVPAGSIVLFDRSSGELERAGFPIQRDENDVRCFGTDALKGGGYDPGIREHRSIGSLFSRILTDHATVLVNVGVCKDHDLSGVSAGCKNLYGLIHNPNRYHAGRCDPFLADLLGHPVVRPKLRLTVIDAITAQCQGGPARVPTYTFQPNRVLLSLDPVAVDRIAWEMIEQERSRRGMPSLAEDGREPTWIATAARLGLGEAERSRIDLREVAA
jgi:uncharacterized protein (DUF362 family)